MGGGRRRLRGRSRLAELVQPALEAFDPLQQRGWVVVGFRVREPDERDLERDPCIQGVPHATMAVPSTSIARTVRAGPIRRTSPPWGDAWPDTAGEDSPSRATPGATAAGIGRGARRGARWRCAARRRPATCALSTACRARLVSRSASETSSSYRNGLSSSTTPEPPPGRAWRGRLGRPATPPDGRLDRGLGQLELGVAARCPRGATPTPRCREGGIRNAASGCEWSAALFEGPWWRARRRRGREAPPASSTVRSRRPARACGPRRRCRPSTVPASPATPGQRGPAWRRRRCWTPRPARGRRRKPPGRCPGTSRTFRTAPPRRARAVQRLRKDPRGRGLSGAPGAGEEVGVCDAVVPNRVAEGVHHVVLTSDLGKALRPITPVQRLIVDHDREPTTCRATGSRLRAGNRTRRSTGRAPRSRG